jgi:hypothetical protein
MIRSWNIWKGGFKMGRISIERNTDIYLVRIDGEKDLTLWPGLSIINPPPRNGRCECCGRYLSELSPFGKVGDPLEEDFEGALLVTTSRPELPEPNAEIQQIYQSYFGSCATSSDYARAIRRLGEDYGDDAQGITYWIEGASQFRFSWECRDCIVLDNSQFFEKLEDNLDERRSWKPRRKVGGKATDIQK